MELLGVAAGVLILNIPFGYWRATEKKFSLRWFLAVHAPVPFIILLRLLAGLGWQLAAFPVLVAAFFSGQFFGGLLHDRRVQLHKTPVTACLIWDLVKNTGRRKQHTTLSRGNDA